MVTMLKVQMYKLVFILLLLSVSICDCYAGVRLYARATQPPTCNLGDYWVDTDGTAGEKFYICEATNTWVRQVGYGTSANPSFNSVHASGGNLAANNKQVTKAWQTGLGYTADVTSVIHGGKHWIAKTTHTAGSTTEPGVGANYTDAWTEVSGGSTDLSNYLSKTNTTAFTPDADYEPATKKYVDDAITAGGGYTDEMAQDAVGGMFAGNTETGITVTYDDATGKVNFVVASQFDGSQSTTGSAGSIGGMVTASGITGALNLTKTGTTARTVTFPDAAGTVALTSDIIAAPTDATITTTDVTTNNASTTKHGWLLKATAPSSGLRNIVAIDNGETVYKNAALFDATSPSTQASGDAAAVGTAMTAARRDHKHAMPTIPSVAGSDTQVVFNDGGSAFVGDAGMTYNKTTDSLTVAGTITAATFSSSAADGSRRSILPENTSIACSAGGVEEIYNEGGAIKACENDTEYDVILSRDFGTGVGTFLSTPSGANLASALTSALPTSKGGTGLTALGTGVATAMGNAVDTSGGLVTYDADLADLADGSLTGTKVGFADTDNLWTASNVQAALEELNDSINAGAPNGTGAKVHWSQLTGVPAGFADGSDDGTGGGISHATSDGTYYASRNGAWSAFTSGNYTLAMTLTGNTAVTLPTSGTLVAADVSASLTNKTLDVEGTGNSITIVDKVWFAAAGCNNATATSFYDLPTSNAPAAACITGTNTQKGVLDFDAATDESAQVSLALPSDFTGAIDVKYKWLAAATSGSVVWGVQTSCVADAETDDPSWNTASTVTDAAKGTTLQTNDASITGVTATGCAAGELLHLRFFRDADNGSDGMTGDARLIGAEVTLRRAQ